METQTNSKEPSKEKVEETKVVVIAEVLGGGVRVYTYKVPFSLPEKLLLKETPPINVKSFDHLPKRYKTAFEKGF